MKTAYNVGISEPSLAIKKFLDDLKVERKKSLTEERRKLASLKAERRKIDALPPDRLPDRIPDVRPRDIAYTLDIQIRHQSQIVRDARHLYEEAQRATEQERIDALAEYALQEWNREEAIRKAEAERLQAQEDDEMMQVLLSVHEL